ncbi:MAG: hypothetical protein JWL61_1828 [Gemmatimonadetes bacterium]|nr:hypothetical protein [Gemmatimonadota bacterium]
MCAFGAPDKGVASPAIIFVRMAYNVFLAATLLCGATLLTPTRASAENYYVNSRAGKDASDGRTKQTAWKSFANLETHHFAPGDSILFAKGTRYVGGFAFRSSGNAEHPIVFTSYSMSADLVRSVDRTKIAELIPAEGAGRSPAFTNPDWAQLNGNIFRIEASYVVIDGFYFHDNTNPPGSDRTNKNVQKMGAVYLALGTHDNEVRNCEFENTPVGIKIKGTHNLITRNYLHDAYEPMAQSWGPIAIMVVTPYNEISHNTIMNYGSYGGPYGSDGGVIELDGVDDAFDGRNVNIHHNTSINNHGFVELAGRKVDSITIAYNLSDDRNQFLGGGSMKNVLVLNNTIVRTREPNIDRYVFWTFAVDTTFITVRNNIFVLAPDLKVFGPVQKQVPRQRTPIGNQVHDHNLFFSPGNPDPVGVALHTGDFVADPLFVDFANRNFRLTDRSPARARGVRSGYTADLDGRALPPGRGAPSYGAYEF